MPNNPPYQGTTSQFAEKPGPAQKKFFAPARFTPQQEANAPAEEFSTYFELLPGLA
jgi:hypothetical protein